MTVGQLLATSGVKSHLSPGDLEKILESLPMYIRNTDPLYIRILVGLGAWVSALFFVGSIASLFFQNEQLILIQFIGIALMTAGITISRINKSLFFNQACLAFVIAGNLLLVFTTGEYFHIKSSVSLVIGQIIVCAVVYPLFNSSIYRFISPVLVAVFTVIWFYDDKIYYLIHLLIAIEALFAGILFLRKKRIRALIPLSYSAAVMLPVTILIMNMMGMPIFRYRHYSVTLWPSSVILVAGLIYLYFYLAGGLKQFKEPWIIIAIASTVLLGIFTTPGILIAIGLLIMGYAFGDKILMALSFLFIPCFLVLFYYSLDIDLAYKSAVIAGSGIVLISVRWLIGLLSKYKVTI